MSSGWIVCEMSEEAQRRTHKSRTETHARNFNICLFRIKWECTCNCWISTKYTLCISPIELVFSCYYEVLGIWDTVQKYLVAVRIPDRKAATMRPIFHHFCNAGIQITTDAWKGYNFLRPDGWRHLMVVHKRYGHLNMEECVCLCSWGILCALWRGLIPTASNGLGDLWKGTCRFVSLTTLNDCFFWGCFETQDEWILLSSILTCILGYSGTILNGAVSEMIKFTTQSTNV